MPGAFVHLELHTDDTNSAKAFYQELFGWNYNDVPMGDAVYTMVASPQQPGAGMQHKGMPDAPTMWLPYITVESVPRTVEQARAAGAEIIVEYMEAPGFGAGAILRDPTGAAFGIWKAEAMPTSDAADAKPEKAAKKAGKKTAAKQDEAPAPTAKPTKTIGKKKTAKQAEPPTPAAKATKKTGKKTAAKQAEAPAPAAAAKPAKTIGKKTPKATKPEAPAPAAKPAKKAGKKAPKAGKPAAPAAAPAPKPAKKATGKKAAPAPVAAKPGKAKKGAKR